MAILLVSIIIPLDHICALPAHSDASPIDTAADLDHGAGHAADGAHIASCDATMSKSVPSPGVHAVGTPTAVLLPVQAPPSVEGRRLLVVESRPPLYLLHALFRI